VRLDISPGEYERARLEVSGCWQWDCDDGYRRLPYQQFKFEFVVGWDGEWRMPRHAILQWLRQHDPRDETR
jgi:hypothetical protein